MKKPDEEVGDAIIAELKKQGLLSDKTIDKLKPKLVAGSLTSADWKVFFEADDAQKGAAK